MGQRKRKNRPAADRGGAPGVSRDSPGSTAALSVTVTLILLVAGGLWMGFNNPHQGSHHPELRFPPGSGVEPCRLTPAYKSSGESPETERARGKSDAESVACVSGGWGRR